MKMLLYLTAAIAVCAAQNLGHIENLKAKSGDESVTLEWDFVKGDAAYRLHKYTLVTDNDFSEDIRCPADHCVHTVDYLEACKEHTFDLTPYFDDTINSGTVDGDTAATTGYTYDKPPNSPSNLRIVSEEELGTTLQWDAPTKNTVCVKSYKVCFRLDADPNPTCDTTEDTTVLLPGLQACGKYHVSVTPVTPTNAEGPKLEQDVTTGDGVPGPPQGVVVGVTTDSTIELKWNDPAINPLCVQDYSITYGEVVSDSRQVLASILNINIEGDEHFDRHANIGPLLACTNYTIEIKSINKAGTESTPVLKNAATNETDPLPPPFIVVDPSSPDTIDVRWGKNEGDRCVGHYVICWNDGIHPADQCEDAFGGNITITDLLACTHYDVTIEVVTPGGIHSKDVTNSTYTFDIAPGAVSDLQVTDVHKNELTISFDPPTVNGQCVKEYDIHVIDLDSQVTMTRLGGPETIENFITGLHSCTNYEIKVRSVSSTEKASEWLTVQNRTQDDIPSKPQQLGMYDSTSSSISLEWYKPSLNPNCASKYTLTWQDSQGHSAHVTVNDQGTFKQRYTVNGLKTCETYTFNLLAESSAGKSNPARYKQSTLC